MGNFYSGDRIQEAIKNAEISLRISSRSSLVISLKPQKCASWYCEESRGSAKISFLYT